MNRKRPEGSRPAGTGHIVMKRKEELGYRDRGTAKACAASRKSREDKWEVYDEKPTQSERSRTIQPPKNRKRSGRSGDARRKEAVNDKSEQETEPTPGVLDLEKKRAAGGKRKRR